LFFSSTFYEFTFKSIPKPNSLQNTNNKVKKKNLKNFLITMLAMLFKAQFLKTKVKEMIQKIFLSTFYGKFTYIEKINDYSRSSFFNPRKV